MKAQSPATTYRRKILCPSGVAIGGTCQLLLRRYGFTIVEMIIVVLIAGILAAAGFPKLVSFAQSARLEQEARIIYNDIRTVRDISIAVGNSAVASASINFGRSNPLGPAPLFVIASATFVPFPFDANPAVPGPATAYNLFDPRFNLGHPNGRVRTLYRDSIGVTNVAREIGTHSVCLYTIPPVATITFDAFGRSTPANITIFVCFYLPDTAPWPRILNSPEVGAWSILISDTAPSCMSLKRL